jgi:hypothetical protein
MFTAETQRTRRLRGDLVNYVLSVLILALVGLSCNLATRSNQLQFEHNVDTTPLIVASLTRIGLGLRADHQPFHPQEKVEY